jgi:hypothetical protein
VANFSVAWLAASLIISAIGYVLLVYGRKMARAPQFVAGMVLLIYPYFVPSVVAMVIVAAVLLAALWLAVKLGW